MRRAVIRLFLVALLGAVSTPALAQTSDRGWIDLNFVSATPSEVGQTYTFNTTRFGEPASFVAVYPELPRVNGALGGGGFRIAGGIGVGFLYTRLKYEYPVGLAISIPHPNFFNRIATDADASADPLERTDNSLDLSLAWQPPTPDTWRIRLFAGPTYFQVTQEFVQDIRFTQQVNGTANVVNITNYVSEELDQSKWGFHAGADAAYFFSRYFGVGATVRFNRATIEMENEPLSETTADLKVGSTVIGAGLRIRF
jgi:hypothetical protein